MYGDEFSGFPEKEDPLWSSSLFGPDCDVRIQTIYDFFRDSSMETVPVVEAAVEQKGI